jgi:hypothetical protein
MSFPIFKDFDRCPADLINDDFDAKYTLKIKSAGPNNTTITTNTALDLVKEPRLVPKVSAKWSHASGFTLEKFELTPDCKMAVETSLTGVAPGLKLEFKGNDTDKSDLFVTYKAPQATITADFDIYKFSSVKASVNSGHGNISAGASVDLKISKASIESTTCGLGAGYTVPNVFFAGLRANNNFASYSGLFNYSAIKSVVVAGSVNYSPKETKATMAASYTCCPGVTMKVKANSTGVFYASLKQSFAKKFVVVTSAEVPSSFNTVKFGVNATLG